MKGAIETARESNKAMYKGGSIDTIREDKTYQNIEMSMEGSNR